MGVCIEGKRHRQIICWQQKRDRSAAKLTIDAIPDDEAPVERETESILSLRDGIQRQGVNPIAVAVVHARERAVRDEVSNTADGALEIALKIDRVNRCFTGD